MAMVNFELLHAWQNQTITGDNLAVIFRNYFYVVYALTVKLLLKYKKNLDACFPWHH